MEVKSDYREPVNLYLVYAARPGERKSAILQEVSSVLEEREAEMNEELKPALRKYRHEKSCLESELKNLTDQIGKNPADSKLRFLALEKREELESLAEVKPVRLTADDSSPEALTSLMADNDGAISVISAEGSIFDIIAGRYSNQKPNMDVFLKGHSGDRIRVDRKNRPAEYIETPSLTMLLAVQPSVLNEIMDNKTMAGRGLIARFLFSVPNSMIGNRAFRTEPVDPLLRKNYQDIVKFLLNIPKREHPNILKFGREALEEIEKYFFEIEKDLKDDYSPIKEWLSKNVGAVARISALLHLASGKIWDEDISAETVRNAIRIGRYFRSHAMFAYSMMDADDTVRKAEFVLSRIREKKIRLIGRRDLLRICRGKYFRVLDDFLPVLSLLEEYGYIVRRIVIPEKSNKPKEVVEVNPCISGVNEC